jgi:hypothetical protein
MKTLAFTIMTVILTLAASVGSAQKPDAPRRDRDPTAQQRQRPGQRQGRQTGDRDPAQLVARMMKEFDKNGDQKLDSKELAALLTSMRERRDGTDGARRGGRPGGQGQGRPEGAQRQRRGDGAGSGKAGGQRPQKPADE